MSTHSRPGRAAPGLTGWHSLLLWRGGLKARCSHSCWWIPPQGILMATDQHIEPAGQPNCQRANPVGPDNRHPHAQGHRTTTGSLAAIGRYQVASDRQRKFCKKFFGGEFCNLLARTSGGGDFSNPKKFWWTLRRKCVSHGKFRSETCHIKIRKCEHLQDVTPFVPRA